MNIQTVAQCKILLVDDHDLVRAGIRLLIQDLDNSLDVIEASSGEESISGVERGGVDIVFMDIVLPGIDGVTTALRLLQLDSNIKIIMLSGRIEGPAPKALLQSGVCGYMTKSSASEEIKNAIDAANRGERYLSPDIASQFDVDSLHTHISNKNPFDRLSQRELQVVLLILQGNKTSDASDSLVLNAKTISTYKRRAFEKLDVENTAELVKLAIACRVLEVS